MENKFNRFLSLLLAFVMVLGMFPVGHVHAEENGNTINLTLRGNSHTITVDGYYSDVSGDEKVSVELDYQMVPVQVATNPTPAGSIKSGATYVIRSYLLDNRGQYYLTSKPITYGNKKGLDMSKVATAESLWVITATDDGYYTIAAKNGKRQYSD